MDDSTCSCHLSFFGCKGRRNPCSSPLRPSSMFPTLQSGLVLYNKHALEDPFLFFSFLFFLGFEFINLDQQVENTNYVFEPKTIQRMELLVLSALKWRMNPVTPLSFLDHTIRRLGLKSYIHLEFVRKCENLIFSIMPDSRFARYLPSVVATATMLRFIHQVEPCTAAIDYENQLLGILKINMEQVKDCSELISETSKTGPFLQKRGFCEVPSSPNGMDALSFSSDSSSDSCGVASCISSSASSSAHQPLLKKRRVQEQQMKLPSLSRVIVDAVGSPR
ncbi:cyclin-D3-3-like isoform X1 [Olea europaea subsp. europaea]|uniref:Cyclin-D3-3-like isoform X1 n=1 Tax=Olea europaea subsp. europaea TaxID=158383 RepID=A0A8S0QEV3_OLEEU|nr:cyclin-D3-3-like isoform X1 [Olea europaea subsp. europaea]